MNKENYQTRRTEIIGKMLDNADNAHNQHNCGIYPTTQCFEELDVLISEHGTDEYFRGIKYARDEINNKEQNKTSMRESGYYWCRITENWIIAYYDKEYNSWLYIGTTHKLCDEDFQEIYETKIVRK